MPRSYPPEIRRQVVELARSGTKVAQLVAGGATNRQIGTSTQVLGSDGQGARTAHPYEAGIPFSCRNCAVVRNARSNDALRGLKAVPRSRGREDGSPRRSRSRGRTSTSTMRRSRSRAPRRRRAVTRCHCSLRSPASSGTPCQSGRQGPQLRPAGRARFPDSQRQLPRAPQHPPRRPERRRRRRPQPGRSPACGTP